MYIKSGVRILYKIIAYYNLIANSKNFDRVKLNLVN